MFHITRLHGFGKILPRLRCRYGPVQLMANNSEVTQLEEFYKPWIELVDKGVGVHCGEGGCYNKTPHNVFLAWFGDVIDILTHHNIGYALWNFRGDFGILDSGRTDIEYTDWYGHKLDSKLLELLKKY